MALTGSQIRMARAALRWPAQELADRAGVHYATVQRAEQADGVPDMRTSKLIAIKTALEDAGVSFIAGTAEDDPGVRLKKGVLSGVRAESVMPV